MEFRNTRVERVEILLGSRHAADRNHDGAYRESHNRSSSRVEASYLAMDSASPVHLSSGNRLRASAALAPRSA